ncbi:YibE/F family protein [Anaerosacchariphilus polymeriproducens]|uniref:YibE/F family protein n=1 Tax=Anaerosacchariphilus polymeriproducens TaxID=1812858 RepID=A0A371AWI0_9FIRM|nr:YibE/F family protein [Anaerosacchariphilus polymeriproducens]RDU23901.1 YibE/F family protein [Anaerosacchariphilus polymeriproducens]
MALIKKYWSNKKVIIAGIVIILFLAVLILADNNYCFYHKTIASVKSVQEKYIESQEGPNGEQEKYYIQRVKAVVRNGIYKGKEINFKNTYSYSGIKNEKYQSGEDIFIEISENDGKLSGTVSGIKRDKYVVFLVGLFVTALVLITGKQGLLTLLSLLVNILIFILAVGFYSKGKDFEILCFVMVILFNCLTLLILGGISRKTIGAMVSTLLAVAATYFIYTIVTFIEHPSYELMDYIVAPNDLGKIFMAGIIIGCLGAIMDVAITMNSAVHEFAHTAEHLTWKSLIKSIQEIGYDIMGTMINVLLFTYISGSLPGIILKIKNGYSLNTLVQFNIVFEIIRFLVGSIGIILAIPISGFIAVVFLKKEGINGNVSNLKHYIFNFNCFSRWRKRR